MMKTNRFGQKLLCIALCLVLLLPLLPIQGRAAAAAVYGVNERIEDFESLSASVGTVLGSSNTANAGVGGWRSHTSTSPWSLVQDGPGNKALYLNGSASSAAWIRHNNDTTDNPVKLNFTATDVLLRGDIKIDATSTNNQLAGLTARIFDNNNMYGLGIRKGSASQYSLVLFQRAGGTITDLSAPAVISDFTAGQYYTLTLLVQGTAGQVQLIGSMEGGPTVFAQLGSGSPTAPTAGDYAGFFGTAGMKLHADNFYAFKQYPGAPTGLTTVSEVDGQVSLRWSGSAGSERYTIKRSINGAAGPYVELGTSGEGVYRDTGVVNGITYHYIVQSMAKASDGIYAAGLATAPLSVTPRPSMQAPVAPAQLTGAVRDTEIALSWSASPDTVGYRIRRSDGDGAPSTVVGSVYATSTNWTDSGLSLGSRYTYSVTAYNETGESAASNVFSGRTTLPPSAPQAVTAVPGYQSAKLQWQSVTDAVYYTVKRASSSGGSFVQVAAQLTMPLYIDSALTNDHTYFYVVQAVNENGSSSVNSAEVSATPRKRYVFTENSISASSFDGMENGNTQSGNKPVNSLDDLATRWSANGRGQWIQFDLGAVSSVGHIGMAFYKGDERAYSFDVLGSRDGINWDTLLRGTSSGSTRQLEAYDLPDSDVRYVRIVGQGNRATDYNGYTVIHLYAPNPSGHVLDPVGSTAMPPSPPTGPKPTKPGLFNPDGSVRAMPEPATPNGTIRNVREAPYSAKGDGMTDDRAAIQSAINAAQPGDTVYVPNGVYLLASAHPSDMSSHLRLKDGILLRGESTEGTILLSDYDNRLGPAPHFENTGISNGSSRVLWASSLRNVVISDLTITSTWNLQYPTTPDETNPWKGGPKHGIWIDKNGSSPGAYNVVVERVLIEKVEKIGVRAVRGSHVVIRNSTFRHMTDMGAGGAGYGVAVQGAFKEDRFGQDDDSAYNLVENNVFDGSLAMRHAIIVQGYTHNNVIRNNEITGSSLDAIDLHGEDEYLNEVYGNTIRGTWKGAAIALGNTGGSFPSNHSESGPYNYIHSNILINNVEGITVSMGSPDTIIENNTITVEDGTLVREPHHRELIGIRLLNAPRTIVRDNELSGFGAADWPIVLAADPGDRNAGFVGAGDPRDVQLLGNRIVHSVNGIKLEAGVGTVTTDSGAPQVHANGNPVYTLARSTAAGGGSSAGTQRLAAVYRFDVSDVEGALSHVELQLSGRLTEVNPGAETLTLDVFGMPGSYAGTPPAVEHAAQGVFLGSFTMRGYRDLTYNVGYKMDSYTVSTDELRTYAESRLGQEAVVLVVDTKGQGVPAQLVGGDSPFEPIRPLLKLKRAAAVPPDGSPSAPPEEEPNGPPNVPPAGGPNGPPVGSPTGLQPPSLTTVPGLTIAATARHTGGGRTVAEAAIRSGELVPALRQAAAGRLMLKMEAEEGVLISTASLSLPSDAIREAAATQAQLEITVATPLGSYTVPLKPWLLDLTGTSGELKVLVGDGAEAIRQTQAIGMLPLGAADYTLAFVKQDGSETPISDFPEYISRTMNVLGAAHRATLAVLRVEADGAYTPVPFEWLEDGKGVRLFSRSNSSYVAVESGVALSDLGGHWAVREIGELANRRIVAGMPDGQFDPDRLVTRAEFAALLVRTLGVGNDSVKHANTRFADVSAGDWYHRVVQSAVDAGLAAGDGNGAFRPNEPISRQEMAVMLDRALRYVEGTMRQPSAPMSPVFADDADVADWSKRAIDTVVVAGLMNGMQPGMFAPHEPATRAQSAAVLHRLLQQARFPR